MIEAKMEEENEKIRRRDWRTEHFSGGEILRGGNVKIIDSGLHFFLFTLFYFSFLFYFLFLEQLELGLIGHAVTTVT